MLSVTAVLDSEISATLGIPIGSIGPQRAVA
jgi:hypothetical protein